MIVNPTQLVVTIPGLAAGGIAYYQGSTKLAVIPPGKWWNVYRCAYTYRPSSSDTGLTVGVWLLSGKWEQQNPGNYELPPAQLVVDYWESNTPGVWQTGTIPGPRFTDHPLRAQLAAPAELWAFVRLMALGGATPDTIALDLSLGLVETDVALTRWS